MREAEEVEGLRLPLPTLLPLPGRVATKADQPGLRRVQRQFERAQPFLEIIEERLRLMLVLEADNSVIRIADDDHVAGRLAAPANGPQVEHVVQIDVRQDR